MLQKLLRIFVVWCGAVVLITATQYEGWKVYDITPQTTAELETLRAFSAQTVDEYEYFSVCHKLGESTHVLVAPEKVDNFKASIQDKQMSAVLRDANYGRTLEERVIEHRTLRQLKPYMGTGRLTTDRFYTHNEINAYLDYLARQYPSRAFVRVYGKSYEGRLLKAITITNGDGRAGKNVIYIDGAFHANEWISHVTVLYVIGELVENYEAHAELLEDYDFLVLPMVNPDGYEYAQLSGDNRQWRKTRQPHVINGTVYYGTDPNRNFDIHWMEMGASADPSSKFYGGPRPFSEPETIVVRDIMHSLRGRGKMYITVHAFYAGLLYPYGWGYVQAPTWKDLDEVAAVGAEAIRAYNGTDYDYGQTATVYGIGAGGADDYAFDAGFPISYTMELPYAGSSGFDPPASEIDRWVKEAWIGIRAMAKRVTEKYPITGSR